MRSVASSIAAGASDLAMVDIMKIGGVTGWLAAMAQAEAAALPLSNHTFVEPSTHVMAVAPTASWFEYLDIAGAVLTERLLPVDGMVTARGPGLGLDWDEHAVARYAFGNRSEYVSVPDSRRSCEPPETTEPLATTNVATRGS